MACGIVVLRASMPEIAVVLGSYPPEFTCPEALLDDIRTGFDYGSFDPWGDITTDYGAALCLVSQEGTKEYITALVSEEDVDLRGAADFVRLVAPQLALAASLDRLEENLPKLAPIILNNIDTSQIPATTRVRVAPSVSAPGDIAPWEDRKVCPFRMSLPEGEQYCIQDRCIAYFGDISQAIALLEQLMVNFAQGENKQASVFGELKRALPKNGCFLIHGSPFGRGMPGGAQ